MTRRAKVLLTAALTAVLALTGASVSWALWATSATVGSTASTATVTVGHALTGSTLAVTYSATTTAAVGVITVTNSGTRSGTYSLALTATSASATMRAATTVEIGTAASCTTTATLTGAVSGNFSAAVTKTGTLAAGASVALCVRTSMSLVNIAANASASLSATAATSIAVGTWSASAATPITFTQNVAAPTGFQSVDSNRYMIYNQGVCIGSNWDFNAIGRGVNCGNDQTSNWRLTSEAGGVKTISRAYNTDTAPANRWNAASATSITLAASSVSTAQRWTITLRPDGTTYEIRSVTQLKCVEIASGGSASLQTCNSASAGQGFTFTAVANSTPAPITLACDSNNTNYVIYTWAVLDGYQAEVDYKVYVDSVFVKDQLNGYWPNVQIAPAELPLVASGNGLHTVEVRQSVSGAAWTVTGTGTLRVTNGNLSCS